MLYLITALSCEASPFLAPLRLKRAPSQVNFPVFFGEDAALIVSGTGGPSAAAAAAHLLTLRPPAEDSLLFNVGVCGGEPSLSPGSLFLCNRIVDASTGRAYYPDLLFSHPFSEQAVASHPQVVSAGAAPLWDMEAAALYESARRFLSPHQLAFFKVVSDHGDSASLTPASLCGAIAPHVPSILRWAAQVESLLSPPSPLLAPEEEESIRALATHLRLTGALKGQLRQLLTYAALSGAPILPLLQAALSQPCNSRQEGRAALAALAEKLKAQE